MAASPPTARARARDVDARLLLAHHARATSPLRYTAVEPVCIEGWLAKEGRSIRTRRNRYFTLNGTVLASHRAKSAAPSWHVSVADALVQRGMLPREIRISLPGRALSFIAPTQPAFEMWIVALRRASLASTRVDEYYSIGSLIGEGMNGQVRLAHDKMTDEPVAIKMVPRLGRQNEAHFLAREVQIILSISHPNIVRTIDVFVRTRRIHFVMEYLAGGELFDFISQNTHFTETHAAAVMTDLLNALHYLHSRNIVHRDVKLENLLCANTTWPLNVKLADFGFANYLHADNRPSLHSFVGTPYYIAPEMLRGDPHGCPVDVWASGVVMYILLSGKFPFGGNNESEYYQRVLAKNAYFPSEEWANVSEDAKSLVRGMLCKDPRKRLTVEQCLAHPWLARAQPVLNTTEPPLSTPEPLVTSEPNLRTATALKHNRTKRGKWRYLAMLNRSLSGAPEAIMPDQLQADYARAKHTLSESATVPCTRSPPSDCASNSVAATDTDLVNRRPSLIRRILSSQKLSLDRFERECAPPRGCAEDKVDEASANPRKTLSLFSKDGPLRRSFHRVSERATDDGINFVNSQSQRLPPKIARERQRQQKMAQAAMKRTSRAAGALGSCKLNSATFGMTNEGYHSSPRLATHLLEPLHGFVMPCSASEGAASGGARSERMAIVDEHGDEVGSESRDDVLHGCYSRARAVPLGL